MQKNKQNILIILVWLFKIEKILSQKFLTKHFCLKQNVEAYKRDLKGESEADCLRVLFVIRATRDSAGIANKDNLKPKICP